MLRQLLAGLGMCGFGERFSDEWIFVFEDELSFVDVFEPSLVVAEGRSFE